MMRYINFAIGLTLHNRECGSWLKHYFRGVLIAGHVRAACGRVVGWPLI